MRNTVSERDAAADADAHWMLAALELAEQSIGVASPNPRVGCVLVKDGAVVGRGSHHYGRRDHAEVVALRAAGTKAHGATAYVTLEPCSHTGRTPPCAQALIEARVSRVVAATGDPNPQVNGQGLALLREAGIAVTAGVQGERARVLNDGFARWVRKGLPFVTLKAGLSLDGRIAPPRPEKTMGSVAYLTGARSLMAVQRLRRGSDAVLTGIGTVLEDNPLLTDRSGGERRRPLLRVVLDSHLRLPLMSRLVQTAQQDVLVCTVENASDSAHRERWEALCMAGVEVCAVPAAASGRVDPGAVLRLLAEERGVLNVLAEGGSQLTRTLLEAEDGMLYVDKLCLFYAPMFLGERGVPMVGGGGPLPLEISHFTLSESGSDFRVEAYLRDPWRAA